MRRGTRKSRAPSGEDAVRIGVENSVKPASAMRLRISEMIFVRCDDVLVQRLAAQVEEAVFQADVFRIVRLAEHRQRQFLGRRQHLDLARENLDLAGRQVRR